MTQITLVLPYPVSSNRYWRPVKLGKHISIVPTKEAKAYKAQVAAMYGGPKIAGRYLLEVFLFPHRPQDWQKRQRQHGAAWDDTVMCVDLGNCEKVLSDALRGVAIEDDKWAREIVLIRMEPDEHGARAVVRITALSVDDPQPALDLPACTGSGLRARAAPRAPCPAARTTAAASPPACRTGSTATSWSC